MNVTAQLRRLAAINPRTPEFRTASGEVTFVPLECVWPRGQADFTRRADVQDVMENYTRFRRGDVLLPKVTPTFQAGRSTVADIDTDLGAATTEVHVLRETPRSEARFLAYLGQAQHFLSEGETVVVGVGNLLRVPQEWVKAFRVPVLTRDEQVLIADLLDAETGQIDAMIEAQTAVVRLTEELRLAAIADELDQPEVSDSPLVPLRQCLKIQTGVTLGKDYGAEAEEYPYLRVANVQAGYLDLTDVKTVAVSPSVAASSTLRHADVLITEGGDRAALGRGALWRDEIPGALHQNHIFALRCDKTLDPEFLVYVLDSPAARNYFESTRRQTTNLSSTNSMKVKAFKIPRPPIHQQRSIVRRLDEAVATIDETLSAAKQVIALLTERREALITAAVMGLIDPHTGIERTEEAS